MQNLDGISLYQNQIMQTGQGSQSAGTEGTSSQDAANQRVAAAQGAAQSSESVAALKQELLQLVRGSVFEGVVAQTKGEYALISLDNGQTIKARLEAGVNVRLGEPVLFEVKSNQDHQILLKQVPVQSQYNPTLQRALAAAGLSLTQRNLDMVNTMMQKQMPIDKGSLNAMARTVQNFGQTPVETLVQMKKLGFEISESAVQQFEAYKDGAHSLAGRFNQMMEQLPELFEGKQDAQSMIEVQNGILEALEQSQGAEAAGKGTEVIGQGAEAAAQSAGQNQEAVSAAQMTGQEPVSAAQTAGQEPASAVQTAEQEPASAVQTAGQENASAARNTAQEIGALVGSHTLAEFLPEEGREALTQQLRQIPGMEEDAALFTDGKLKDDLGAKELLQSIQRHLSGWPDADTKVLKELFSGKEYKSLLKQVMEEQWLLEPRQTQEKENVDKLYERLNRQMEKLEQFLQDTGKDTLALNKNVSQVRGNLEMMNQINQLYNYVQIPLKLHNQNAHSDLYVYTNKKKLQDRDGEMSALLHLELEHLGTTDVQIKMVGSNVTTNFYLADDASYELVEQHMGELQKVLEKKGYHCSIYLENREEKVDFVQDFLEHETPVGKLQRYSFDVLT